MTDNKKHAVQTTILHKTTPGWWQLQHEQFYNILIHQYDCNTTKLLLKK